MHALKDLFTSDVGLMSVAGITFMLGMAVFSSATSRGTFRKTPTRLRRRPSPEPALSPPIARGRTQTASEALGSVGRAAPAVMKTGSLEFRVGYRA